jgi:lactate dehydrogenase-like 2-hydroxyacid dehydrogenase
MSFSNYFLFLIARVADNILSLLAPHLEATHHLIKAKSLLQCARPFFI